MMPMLPKGAEPCHCGTDQAELHVTIFFQFQLASSQTPNEPTLSYLPSKEVGHYLPFFEYSYMLQCLELGLHQIFTLAVISSLWGEGCVSKCRWGRKVSDWVKQGRQM